MARQSAAAKREAHLAAVAALSKQHNLPTARVARELAATELRAAGWAQDSAEWVREGVRGRLQYLPSTVHPELIASVNMMTASENYSVLSF